MTPPSRHPSRHPSWRTWVGRAYVVGVLAAAVTVSVVQRQRIADLIDDARPVPLIAALLLGFGSLVQSAWIWSRGLGSLGSRRSLGEVLEATVVAIPARYVPGSIWYAAGRIGVLRASGTAAAPLAVMALLEMLLSFLIAVVLGLGALAAGGSGEAGVRVVSLVATSVVIAVVASPWVLNPVVAWAARRRGIATVPSLRWSVEAELCAHLVAFWITSATAFVLYLSAFPAVDAPDVVRTAGAFLVGWAAGFLVVFAPQGAGVLETAVAGALDGAPVAALAVVVAGYRALIGVRDVIALIGLAIARRRFRRSHTHENRMPSGTATP